MKCTITPFSVSILDAFWLIIQGRAISHMVFAVVVNKSPAVKCQGEGTKSA